MNHFRFYDVFVQRSTNNGKMNTIYDSCKFGEFRLRYFRSQRNMPVFSGTKLSKMKPYQCEIPIIAI